MGRPTGFEPATPRITILCSNQLSYGRRAEGRNSRAASTLSRPSSNLPQAPTGVAHSGLTPLPQPIEEDRHDDHQTNNNFLEISRPTHLLRAVAQDRHD